MDVKITSVNHPWHFLEGGGEAGALVRSIDWRQTPLGSPDTWPQSLRSTVHTLLNAGFPTLLWWGSRFILFYNDPFRDLLARHDHNIPPIGKSAPEALGMRWQQRWHAVRPLVEHVLSGGGPVWEHVEDLHCRFCYSEVQDDSGKIAGVLITGQETSRLPSAHADGGTKTDSEVRLLDAANANLQQINEELEQLAYVASHDLQEPLRKVVTFTDMLSKSLGNDVNERSKNYMDRISAASSRMMKMVKDILHFSQLSARGQLFVPIDLNTVLDQVKDDYELLIKEKQATITSTPLPVIEGIPVQIAQLFANLLSNSLKFSRPGVPPVVQISAAPLLPTAMDKYPFLNPKCTYYCIEVKDNGIGFEPEYGEQIFTLFRRLHGKNEFPGSGIGLALCRKIALGHHGHILAGAVPGEGAVFSVVLPEKQL